MLLVIVNKLVVLIWLLGDWVEIPVGHWELGLGTGDSLFGHVELVEQVKK